MKQEQDRKLMPPPWLAYPESDRYSIGWRMGYGEDYIFRFHGWMDTLSQEEKEGTVSGAGYLAGLVGE